MDDYELRKHAEGWQLIKQGGVRPTRVLPSKAEALDFASKFGKSHPMSLKIKGENGRIQEERTYPRSADPKKSKG